MTSRGGQTSRLALAAAFFALALPAAPAAAAPGDLDPAFGSGGRATLDLKNGDLGFGATLSPGGAIVIVGDTDYPADRGPGVARLTPGGVPDPTFGGGSGFVTANPSPAAPDFTENVQLQVDGAIVVGGSFDGNAGILRYRTDGLPDTGFDGDGVVKTEWGHPQRAGGIQLLPDGRILWFGRGDYPGGERDLDLARYEADGLRDTSFGASGLVRRSLRPATDYEGYNVALLQPDGKILIGGSIYRGASKQDWGIARLHPDGSFDTSFDGDGRLATPFAGNDYLYDLALQPDGKIVAVGVRDGTADIAIARYLPGGGLDPTFDGDGKRTIDLGGAETGEAVVLQPNGKIVVAGYTDAAGTKDMAIVRLLPGGAFDPGFGVGGIRFIDFAASSDEAHDLLLQPDGNLVVTGWAEIGGALDFAAARLQGDPAQPQAGPADKEATIRILGRRLRVNRRGIARLRLLCPAAEQSPPCTGKVALRTQAKLALAKAGASKRRRLTLSRARYRIAAGKSKGVRLRIRGRKLALLRRSRRARRVLAIARVRDAAGNQGRVRKRLRLIPAAPKKKTRLGGGR